MAAGAEAIWSWLEDGTGGHRVAAQKAAEALATPAGVFKKCTCPAAARCGRGAGPLTRRRACDADADRRWRVVIR